MQTSLSSSQNLSRNLQNLKIDEISSDVYSWGQGVNGRLGHGDEIDVLTPKIIRSFLGMDMRAIACGPSHSAAITVNGELYTWGSGKFGRLGQGNERDKFTPLCVSLLRGLKVIQVACGDYHTAALIETGEVYTWGKGAEGRLGHGDEDDQFQPRLVTALTGIQVTFIDCGYVSSAAVTANEKVYSWGGNEKGQLGLGDNVARFEPAEIITLTGKKIFQISCATWHCAAVSLDGDIYTWGNGLNGKLGHTEEEDVYFPTKIEGLTFKVKQVSCGDFHTAILSDTGEIYTWGEGGYGQLGHGAAITQYNKPLKINKPFEGRVIVQVACGSNHTSALTNNGALYTWGYGVNGRLGHGDENEQKVPKIVMHMVGKHVRQVACGGSHSACTIIHGWIPDDEVTSCMSCTSTFSFYKRKHHCRNCGGVFCGSCSRKRFQLEKDRTLVRVCDKCFDSLIITAEKQYT